MSEPLNFQTGSEVQQGAFPFSVVEASTGRVIQSGTTMHTEGLIRDGQMLLESRAPSLDAYWEGAWRSPGTAPSPNHIFNYTDKAWHDPRSLAQVKAAQIATIDNAFEGAAQALTAGYPPTERSTWFMQQSEALAWGADNTRPTPYLDGIAQARGIPPAEMREKTLGNVQLFMSASQHLIGTRQALRDAISAAATEAEVSAIAWSA